MRGFKAVRLVGGGASRSDFGMRNNLTSIVAGNTLAVEMSYSKAYRYYYGRLLFGGTIGRWAVTS